LTETAQVDLEYPEILANIKQPASCCTWPQLLQTIHARGANVIQSPLYCNVHCIL